MGDKLPQSTPVLVRRLKRVAANCLKASRAATTDADRISWNARSNTCWQCVARLEELADQGPIPQVDLPADAAKALRDNAWDLITDAEHATAPAGELDAQLLPVYFGLVATLAEVLGPDT